MPTTRRPLLLWHTCLWAAMYSWYSSVRKADVVSMSERLAMCLIMLALLPAKARRKRRARAKALAREAGRAAKHLPQRGEPQLAPGSVFFKACPVTSPLWQNRPDQDLCLGKSDTAQETIRGRSQEMCHPLLSAPGTALRMKRKRSMAVQKQAPLRMRLTMSDEEQPERLSATPTHDSRSVESGPDTPTQVSPLQSGAAAGTKRGGNEEGNAGGVPPSCAEVGSADVSDRARPLFGQSMDGKFRSPYVADRARSGPLEDVFSTCHVSQSPGPLLRAEEHSMAEPGTAPKKGSGGEQAGDVQPLRRGTRKKRKAGPGDSDGVACKLARPSEGQKVGGCPHQLLCVVEILGPAVRWSAQTGSSFLLFVPLHC